MKAHAVALIVLSVTAVAARGAEVDVTWDGATGNWTDSAHWGLASGYPDNGQPAGTTYGVTINSGTITVPAVTLDRLTLGSVVFKSVNVPGSFTITTALDFTAPANAAIYLLSTHTLSSATTTIGATANYVIEGAAFTNDGAFNASSGCINSASFVNNGTLTVQDNGLVIESNFSNNGLIHVASGTLTSTGSGASNLGSLQLDAPGTLQLLQSQSAAGSSLTGAGTVHIASATFNGTYNVTGTTFIDNFGTATFNGDATMAAVSLHGKMNGSGALTINGPVDWQSGGFFSVASTTVNGDITTSSSASSGGIGSSFTLTAGHTATLGGASGFMLSLASDAVFKNQGLVQANAGSIRSGAVGADHPATLLNEGTLTINAASSPSAYLIGDSSSVVPLIFQNAGLLQVASGDCEIYAPDSGLTTGTFDVAAGATLTINSAIALGPTSHLTGAGTIVLAQSEVITDGRSTAFSLGGAVDLAGTLVTSFTPIHFDGTASIGTINAFRSTFLGDGSLTITGNGTLEPTTLNVHQVTITGNTTLKGATTSPAITLAGGTVTVASGGTLTLNLFGSLAFQGQAALINNGTIDAHSGTSSLFAPTGSPVVPVGQFTNNGVINAGGSFGLSSTVRFDNNGTVNVVAGFVTIASTGTDSAASLLHILPNGTFNLSITRPLSAGTLNNENRIVANAGVNHTVTLGAGLTFQNSGTLDVKSGTLELAAAQDSATTGVFLVESVGILKFAADYSFALATDPTLSGDGTVIVDSGTTLTLAQDTAFSGTIQVNGTLIIAPPRDANAVPGSLMQFTVVTQPAPEPATAGMLALAVLPLLLRRRR